MAQNMTEVERALGQLQVNGKKKEDALSIRSGVSAVSKDDARHSDDEGAPSGPVSNPRAVLALKAAQYAEREAQEERERAERRRAADEAVYALARGENGIADGIQMSDESGSDEDDEDDDDMPGPPRHHSSANSNRYQLPPIAVTVNEPSPNPNESQFLAPVAPKLAHSRSDVGSVLSDASHYTDPASSHSTPPPFLIPSPRSVSPATSSTPKDSTPSPSKASNFLSNSSSSALGGLAGVAAAALSSLNSAAQADPPLAARTPSPAPATSQPSNSSGNGHGLASYSPSGSLGSHSRSSSRLGTAQTTTTAASNATGDTSPRDSAFGAGANSVIVGSNGNLPYDPRTWGVKEVCEWGKVKGFDDLTLSKFQGKPFSSTG